MGNFLMVGVGLFEEDGGEKNYGSVVAIHRGVFLIPHLRTFCAENMRFEAV
jgi:hypothetical protein